MHKKPAGKKMHENLSPAKPGTKRLGSHGCLLGATIYKQLPVNANPVWLVRITCQVYYSLLNVQPVMVYLTVDYLMGSTRIDKLYKKST